MPAVAKRKIACIVGARPNFVKIAPVLRALRARSDVAPWLIHTGQHYDQAMNHVFFDELGIQAPDLNLEIGSGSATAQVARIMLALEPVFMNGRPDLVLVVGDVNSTLAAALVAVRLGIPVAHVEAGLRSGDRGMPEEINRLLTDRLSDLLLTTEPAASANLAAEGIAGAQVVLVGNVMIDSLFASLARAVTPVETMRAHGAGPAFAAESQGQGYGFVTLHRPSNVDDPVLLERLLEAVATIGARVPLVFALHPRTRATVASAGLGQVLARGRILVTPPLSYLETIGLMRDAKLVITDSGGIQEETTALGVPCLTVRDTTERPVTIAEGTNVLVGTNPAALIEAANAVLAGGGRAGRIPALWDGKAAQRIAEAVARYLAARPVTERAPARAVMAKAG